MNVPLTLLLRGDFTGALLADFGLYRLEADFRAGTVTSLTGIAP